MLWLKTRMSFPEHRSITAASRVDGIHLDAISICCWVGNGGQVASILVLPLPPDVSV